MLGNLYEFKKELNTKGIFFCFSGPISQDILVEIGSTLKHKMKMEEASNSTVIRVFSLVVEKAQNIIHYSAEKIPDKEDSTNEDELSLGIIAVGYDNDGYYVLCGNMIKNANVERLRKRLLKIQKMNKDELKKYYREKRKKNVDEYSKGAGLGLIEMAKKASRPIEFNFRKINDTYSFFSSKTVI